MSICDANLGLPTSHYFLTVSRGHVARTLAIRPIVLHLCAGVLALGVAWSLAVGAYVVFHDDLVAELMARQGRMQYAYEDRLAAMRAEVDRTTSRQLLDRDLVEAKVGTIMERQARIEGRAAVVAALAGQVGLGRIADATARSLPARLAGATARPSGTTLPRAATGYAATETPAIGFPQLTKPRPEIELVPDSEGSAEPLARQGALEPSADTPALRLTSVEGALDRAEASQITALATIGASARGTIARVRGALAQAGLRDEKLVGPTSAQAGMGGPFVPIRVDAAGSPFERQLGDVQPAVSLADRLTRLLPTLPFARPQVGAAEVTSPFGVRVDPFLGRPALHTGMDFREDYGAPVLATAAGRVEASGPAGGYGNMVEIDHGNGLSTRYGHLSAVLVSPGQQVERGAVIGRAGSTGRSTGTHLHYETRVNGEPVDPVRFLRAGELLAAGGP